MASFPFAVIKRGVVLPVATKTASKSFVKLANFSVVPILAFVMKVIPSCFITSTRRVTTDLSNLKSGIPNRNQFNSIHEDLIKRWKTILPRGSHVHFAACQEAGREDWGNLEYLMDTAFQAHLQVSELSMENIGWDGQSFVDLNNRPIQNLFKLYPWEWIWEESFSQYLSPQTNWIEPCWKMLLSNKAILVELWKRYPNHPLLVETHHFDPQQKLSGKWVKKPILAREGANIRVLQDGQDQGAASGSFYFDDYDKYGYVVQKWVDTPLFAGQLPTLGLWMVGHQCAGMSIREDCYDIIGNDAHFAAHYFVE